VVLVDLDRFGGGLDLALGAEDVPGVRWPDLLASPGVADGPRMVRTLPAVDGLAVLSHARGGRNPCVPPAGVVDDVIRGCAVTGMLVVIDLPRTDDAVTRAAVGRCGVLVVVVPAEVRACASAAAVVEALAPDTPDVRLLVRGPSPAGLQAEDVAVAVGVPTFAEIRPEPGLAGTLERGDPVAAGSRSPLRRWARAILADREES
jgi:secretion/DNA translocation related CpaE-like protein